MKYKYTFNPLTQKLDKVTVERPELAVELLGDITKEPTGHKDRSESVIAFNNATRTFSISPVGTHFTVYTQGRKIDINTTLTLQLPDVTDGYFLYIDELGALAALNYFDVALLSPFVYTGYVLWSQEQQEAIIFGEERHGLSMDGATHSYLHLTRGTQLVSGGAIGYTTGDGSLDSHASISISGTDIADEDILMSIRHADAPSLPFEQILAPIAKIPVYYRLGDVWRKDIATDFPIKQGTLRPQYNRFTTTWTTEDSSTDGEILVNYIFATNNIFEPIICILGQKQYANIAEAQADARWGEIDFGDIPFEEIKMLHALFFETSSTFANTAKCRVVLHRDVRAELDREFSAVTQNSDHGNLTGLGDDDHLQYLNRTGVRAMLGDLNMGSHDVVNAGTYNGVAVEAHSSRHAPNGIDALPTAQPIAIGSVNTEGTANAFARADHGHAHGNQGGGALHSVATTATPGFMSAADKAKLDSLITVSEIIANNTISTTNGGFSVISGMTVTPAAGTYLLSFAANYSFSNQGDGEIQLYIGGAAVSNTTQVLSITGSGLASANGSWSTAFNKLITVNGSQVVDTRWRATNGTFTVRTRSMHLIKVV